MTYAYGAARTWSSLQIWLWLHITWPQFLCTISHPFRPFAHLHAKSRVVCDVFIVLPSSTLWRTSNSRSERMTTIERLAACDSGTLSAEYCKSENLPSSTVMSARTRSRANFIVRLCHSWTFLPAFEIKHRPPTTMPSGNFTVELCSF